MTETEKTPPTEAVLKKNFAPEGADPIDIAIANFEHKLCTSDMDIKLADYLRLLQIRKEREDRCNRDITVRWIESWETEAEL